MGQRGGGAGAGHTDQQRAIMSERELTYGEAVREAIVKRIGDMKMMSQIRFTLATRSSHSRRFFVLTGMEITRL
ncbi:MAG TPA: hypothetical protein VKG64_01580 [Methylomirabilota bacterium]|nr:hypothetical protein [Methylomirabilota bacterium]